MRRYPYRGHWPASSRIAETTGAARFASPDRRYLAGIDGRIAYAGGRGPWDFRPGDLEKAIDALPENSWPTHPVIE